MQLKILLKNSLFTQLFLKMLREAAQDAGRDARLLEPLIQSRDHPASLASEQSLYLKGDILQIL